jgi:hypothetical protein
VFNLHQNRKKLLLAVFQYVAFHAMPVSGGLDVIPDKKTASERRLVDGELENVHEKKAMDRSEH